MKVCRYVAAAVAGGLFTIRKCDPDSVRSHSPLAHRSPAV
jgi:hypothetical protein